MSNPREQVYLGKEIIDVLTETAEYDVEGSYSVARSAKNIMRSYILEATSNSTLSPFVYKDIMRALLVSFGNMHYVDGNGKLTRIKCVHGNPERTIARLHKEDSIILPIITMHQDGAKGDNTKRRLDDMIIEKTEWNDEIQRAERVIGVADVPVVLNFNVNLWCKYMEDLDQISQAIRTKFNPSVTLKTPVSPSIKSFLVSENIKSTPIYGDREDRVLRKSFAVDVEAYIPSPKFKVTSTGRVEKIVSELWISQK
tara:strand:- start:5165 stop:5929 length:765 start_codon:yes stop_codon:yes gene_type:complete